MGTMDTHVRKTLPTEKEEFEIEGACTAFIPNASPEMLASCDRLSRAIQEKNWEEAGALAETFNRLTPDNGLGPFWLGYLDFLQGKRAEGIKLLETALQRSPDVSLARINLGLGYLKVRQSKLFEKEMRWVIANQPADPRPFYFLGRYFAEDLERLDEGAAFFRQALNRDPQDYRCNFHLGLAYEMKGELEQAKAEYQKAASLANFRQSAYAYPLEGLARISWQQQNPGEALHYAQRAVSIDPSFTSGRLMLGHLYLQTGADEKAIAELKMAAKLDPIDPTPHYMLARAYRKLKLLPQAQREEAVFAQLKAGCGEK